MLAAQALSFITEEPQSLSRFLDTSGISAAQIRTAAIEPGFLAGVLEYMLSDETLLRAFADRAGIDPGTLAGAASALGGGAPERDLP
jgi:hypothetical protein